MEKTLRLEYQEIYRQVGELRNILEQDVILESGRRTGALCELLSEMSGRTNETLLQTAKRNHSRVESTGEILLSLLEFMELSTRGLEEQDEEMATQIAAGGAPRKGAEG